MYQLAMTNEALDQLAKTFHLEVSADQLRATFDEFVGSVVFMLRTQREEALWNRYNLAGMPFGKSAEACSRWFNTYQHFIPKPEQFAVSFPTGYGRTVTISVEKFSVEPPLDQPTMQELHGGVESLGPEGLVGEVVPK